MSTTSQPGTAYALDVKPTADGIFARLSRRDPELLRKVHLKIWQIRKNPHHTYKFLKGPISGFNRVHIDTHFVLIFRIDHAAAVVDIHYFDHHDRVYAWRPDSNAY